MSELSDEAKKELVQALSKDLGPLSEDERIKLIGETAVSGKTVGFFTDATEGKADRYVDKLTERYPGIRVLYAGPGPLPGVVFVKVAPPLPGVKRG